MLFRYSAQSAPNREIRLAIYVILYARVFLDYFLAAVAQH